MVEMDLEDERFVDGIGGYSMPSKSEEVTPGDEEVASKSDDSEYEVGESDASDVEGGAGSSGWMASDSNDDIFMRALQAIINSGGTATKSVADAMEKVSFVLSYLLPFFLSFFLFSFFLVIVRGFFLLPTCLRSYPPACLTAFLPASLPAFLPAFLPTFLPTFRPFICRFL